MTFNGSQSATMPTGQELKSGPATWHFNSNQNTYFSNTGDHTSDTEILINLQKLEMAGTGWVALMFLAHPSVKGAVVTLGDSITDGWQ
ncbi:hypothetical protein [Neobacillus cucumis]|uniref:hypothetical protein n=1 Tax=Neobacillus cucumis TaxID=1740721 RepID=UPI002E212BB5|nr:hypothetical protein [Neobacillus cucumis]